jgi:neutral ceramidase
MTRGRFCPLPPMDVLFFRRLSGLALVWAGLSVLGSASAQGAPRTLRAGASAVDITPREFPLNMPGGFSSNMAESAHDPLYARSVVLEDGVNRIALTVVDTLGAGPEVLDEIKSIASEKTGIPAAHMLISSTHTHTGPSHPKEGPAPAVAYRKVFVDGVAQSLIQANATLQPAEIGFAMQPLQDEVFNRRWYLKPGKMTANPFGRLDSVKTNPGTSPEVLERPAGPTDPDLSILSIQNAKHRPLALYANYALHYVGGAPKGQISADYFGEFARVFPSRVGSPEGFVAMLSNGASGDINNIPFGVTRPPREPFEQIRIVAQKAADTAWRALRTIERHRTEVRVEMREREVELRFRRPSPEDVALAKEVLAVKEKSAVEQLPRLAQNYARNVVRFAERPEQSFMVKVQALRIGDIAVCGIPFETFVEIGLDLKKRSPFPHTIVVGLANGRHGYLPTFEQHTLGGYETWLGTNQVQEDASILLTDTLLQMLQELRSLE